MHGAAAPSDGTLKKWSATGEFRGCLASALAQRGVEPADAVLSSKATRSRPGRPGLQLVTDQAIQRVYELWPQLADTNPKAIFDEAVARTARQLSTAILPWVSEVSSQADRRVEGPSAESAEQRQWRERMEERVEALSQDMKDLRREMAQFTALRNNLFTRLDEVIVRSREASTAAARDGAADPIAEARRERDMRALKASVDRIAEALERSGLLGPESGRSV